MSLGSRFATRARAAIVANLAASPREPLLFLYPRWIRESSTSTHSPAAASGQNDPSTKTRPQLSSTSSSNIPRPLDSSFNNATPSQYPSKAPIFDPTIVTTLAPFPTSATVADPEHTHPSQSGAGNDTEPGGKEPYFRPATVDEKAWRLLKRLEIDLKAKEKKSINRRAILKERQDAYGLTQPDWRSILRSLDENTPDHGKWMTNAVRIEISAGSVGVLLQSIDEFILDIGHRYDCVITPEKVDATTGYCQTFLMSGSALGMSSTVADILLAAPDTVVKLTGREFAGLQPPPVSSECSLVDPSLGGHRGMARPEGPWRYSYDISNDRPETTVIPIELLQEPAEWTPQSFLDYIRRIRNADMPSHLTQIGLPIEENQRQVAINILEKLFANPECEHAITRTACHEAMDFFFKCSEIANVRHVFNLMIELGIQLVPETFNIMLRAAAKREDAFQFQFLLHLMLKRGISPNNGTWTAFTMCRSDPRFKLHIFHKMKTKGLLSNPTASRSFAAGLVRSELDASFSNGLENQEAFMAHMDSRYGLKWLSEQSANMILDGLASRGLISRCWEFLHTMDSRFVRPDKVSVHTILHHCRNACNISGAIEVLKRLPPDSKYEHDQRTYEIMFNLAFETKSYNLARVVWRYACLAGDTDYKMRKFIINSLFRLFCGQPDFTATGRWKKFYGAVVLGELPEDRHSYNNYREIIDNYRSAFSLPFNERPVHLQYESAKSFIPDNSDLNPPPTPIIGNQPQPTSLPVGTSETPPPSSEIVPSSLTKTEEAPSFLRFSPSPPPPSPENLTPDSPLEHKIAIFDQLIYPRVKLGYEIFLRWQPAVPFVDMLEKAAERDLMWRRKGMWYEEKDVRWFLGNAVQVPILRREGEGKGKRKMWV